VRVVAGRLRGRALVAPPGDATRPTGARVKEALFSILGDVTDLRVLDLYAGSGALGIEALSRGASFATCVESARPALVSLRENLSKLGLEQTSQVLPLRVESARQKLLSLGPYDLTLCDPPWRDVESALGELEKLARIGLFSAAARVVLEHAARTPLGHKPEESALVVRDRRSWGDTAITLFGLVN
jgi:16S rRNA (guanine966-N2)-methyltransferase